MGLATVSRRAKRSARAGFRIVIVLLEGAEWKPREHIAANGGIEAMVAAMRGHVQDLAVRGGNSLPSPAHHPSPRHRGRSVWTVDGWAPPIEKQGESEVKRGAAHKSRRVCPQPNEFNL